MSSVTTCPSHSRRKEHCTSHTCFLHPILLSEGRKEEMREERKDKGEGGRRGKEEGGRRIGRKEEKGKRWRINHASM